MTIIDSLELVGVTYPDYLTDGHNRDGEHLIDVTIYQGVDRDSIRGAIERAMWRLDLDYTLERGFGAVRAELGAIADAIADAIEHMAIDWSDPPTAYLLARE